ncbi:MAG: glycerate kinase [Polyangiaceae bacterium]
MFAAAELGICADMRWLVAPDSFKGTLTAELACDALAAGILASRPDDQVEKCPLADGGEGTTALLSRALDLEIEEVRVNGPLAHVDVNARVAWGAWSAAARLGFRNTSRIAVFDVASVIGLSLVPPELRNPIRTTSYGVGSLLEYVTNHGADALVIGLGGTATLDGGVGMLQALGARLDARGMPCTRIACGQELLDIIGVRLTSMTARPLGLPIIAATDVHNPLFGPRGAAYAFGPQKGASAQDVGYFEPAMERYVRLLRQSLRMIHGSTPDVSYPGSGAAGGIGFVLRTVFRAQLKSGIEVVMNALDFDARLDGVDAIVTGEGCLDKSSFEGKVVWGVLERAKARSIPTYVVAGTANIDPEKCAARGVAGVIRLDTLAPESDDAKSYPEYWLREAGMRLGDLHEGYLDRQKGRE